MNKLKVPDKLPEWFVVMPKNAKLSAKEVATLFGFKNSHVVTSEVYNGHFPVSDLRASNSLYGEKTAKMLWTKSTILSEISRRRKINEHESKVVSE